jgi:hypothetical protein
MQKANTLFYKVQMQKNNSALFIVFSFAEPVQQRTAHSVVTHAKTLTSAKLAQLVAVQAKFDNAADTLDVSSTAMCKLLQKNDTYAAAQQVAYY